MAEVQILTLSCRDRIGITARVTSYLLEKGGNVLEAQQFNDLQGGDFFMRVAFDPGPADPDAVRAGFADLASDYGMRWNLRSRARPRKVAQGYRKESLPQSRGALIDYALELNPTRSEHVLHNSAA